jgi:drug/metabolite transporter (DMT)-like permease
MPVHSPNAPARWLVIAAFAAIYLIWGSSYLAIKFAIESMPPFLMGGTRFFAAGLILIVWSLRSGALRPTRKQWRSAAVVGVMLFVCNFAPLVWAAAQHVPSGMSALLIASTPMWMVVFDWARPGGQRPTMGVLGGLTLGTLGILLLMDPSTLAAEGHAGLLPGMIAVIIAAALWAAGSIYARQADMPESSLFSTGIQLFSGGIGLMILGLVAGEGAHVDLSALTVRSVLSWLHLVLFSSVVAFSAFVWLLRVCPPARVSTYAYVNPVIAVLLGALLASEPLTPSTIIASVIIIGAVMLINTARAQPEPRPAPPRVIPTPRSEPVAR